MPGLSPTVAPGGRQVRPHRASIHVPGPPATLANPRQCPHHVPHVPKPQPDHGCGLHLLLPAREQECRFGLQRLEGDPGDRAPESRRHPHEGC